MSIGKGSLERAARTNEDVANTVICAPSEQVKKVILREEERKGANMTAAKKPEIKKTAAKKPEAVKAETAKAETAKTETAKAEINGQNNKNTGSDVKNSPFIEPPENDKVVSHLICDLPTYLL